jgi:AbrB family looped-hinge helix DNA binding protein
MKTLQKTFLQVSERGQITIPKTYRQAFGMTPGKKVSLSVTNNTLILETPEDISGIREKLKEQMKSKGTLGIEYSSGEGVTAYLKEKYDS